MKRSLTTLFAAIFISIAANAEVIESIAENTAAEQTEKTKKINQAAAPRRGVGASPG